MASANPAMNPAVFQRAGYADSPANVMTIQGTVLKTAVLLAVLLVTAAFTWTQFYEGNFPLVYGLLMVGMIGGLITALVTCFVPRAAPFSAPIYAAFEGLFLGGISAVMENAFKDQGGIVVQAVGLTIGVLAIMLFVYATGIIRATERFKIGIVAATGAVCLIYMVTMVLSLFGVGVPYIHDSGPIGIGFSLVVVVIAALNLILDFDFIEQGARAQAPKFMEWYGGFSLLVTLVWMYLEILRLLAKINGNRN